MAEAKVAAAVEEVATMPPLMAADEDGAEVQEVREVREVRAHRRVRWARRLHQVHQPRRLFRQRRCSGCRL